MSTFTPDKPNQATHSLENAPDDIKLAVDLIYLLESNKIPVETALSALEIVKTDLKRQLTEENR
ncbi:Protein of unknown function [Vibrio xiamenensis]|uniref:Primosomal protein n=1 Tax=Vibrio xiamenensis TaxID=861298 RepID=A0A1G7WPU4_9VIBR|nr:pleiotropic regulatory protein RsmS [Vibrio xiamenensis]SDG73942.1 Protein of unknown function [Vibrio xiamenensis]